MISKAFIWLAIIVALFIITGCELKISLQFGQTEQEQTETDGD